MPDFWPRGLPRSNRRAAVAGAILGNRSDRKGVPLPCLTGVARTVCLTLLAWVAAAGSDLADLAALDGAPGDESRIIQFIANRVGGAQSIGGAGSLVAEFGQGAPRTLLIAGVDEPGFAVSGIHEEGYLHLRSLAGGSFAPRLESYFLGQHVRVSTRSGRVLPGVVAAPSVHFASLRGSRRDDTTDLYVDIGASSAREVSTAGVEILDRVTLDKRVAVVGDGWTAAPWISSRSGAAIQLELGKRLRGADIKGTVTLAFVTQQYPHSAGLARVLGSIAAERIVLLAPNGGSGPAVAPCDEANDDLLHDLVGIAEKVGLRLERRRSHSPSFGPFSGGNPLSGQQNCVVILPGVRNGATPAEAVRESELSGIARLLGLLIGAHADPPPDELPDRHTDQSNGQEPRDTLEQMVMQLTQAPGVSGKEQPVKALLEELVPRYAVSGIRTDDRGNLIVRVGSGDKLEAAFIAHMDEIGYSVTRIAPNGSVSVRSKGGGSQRLFAWQPSLVHGSFGSLDAMMTNDGRLDLGEDSSDALKQKGLREGDTATTFKRYRQLLSNRVSGRSLDDRLGCAALLEGMRRLAGPVRRATGAVEFVFTVEEETGLQGARHYAKTAVPARVYAIDTFVTSQSPLEVRTLAYARLGEGAVMRAIDESGMTSRPEVARVAELAKRHGIPLQFGVTAGGNDGSVFMSLETVNIPLGFPLRYAHTAVETADLRDAAAVADLIEVLALEGLRRR